jgi:hypothetical protein
VRWRVGGAGAVVDAGGRHGRDEMSQWWRRV